MIEQKFMVVDADEHILATEMSFEMTMRFIRGYKEMFFNEPLKLTIKEITIYQEYYGEEEPNI